MRILALLLALGALPLFCLLPPVSIVMLLLAIVLAVLGK
jgi:hypothetical protein